MSILSQNQAICDEAVGSTSNEGLNPPSASGPRANREIVKTLVVYYLNGRKFLEAKKYLASHLESDPTDGEAWRLYGLVLGRLGELQDAKNAFSKAAEFTTGIDRGANLYLLADVQVRSGEVETGKATLNSLKDVPGFSAPVEDAQVEVEKKNMLPPLDMDKLKASHSQNGGTHSDDSMVTGRHPMKYTLTLTSGYDTNVLLLPDFAVGASPSSAFISPTFQAEYVTKIFKGELNAQGSLGYSLNFASALLLIITFQLGLVLIGIFPVNPDSPLLTKNLLPSLTRPGCIFLTLQHR